MNKFNLLTLLVCLLIHSQTSSARVHPYETTRLKSTSGAGVATFLLEEGAILNPAPLAFFRRGSIYYQKGSSDYRGNTLVSSSDNYEDEQQTFIVSDTKGTLKGAIAYTKQTEKRDSRVTWSAAMAQPIGQNSSFGLIYKRSTEENRIDNQIDETTFNQVTFGFMHVLSKNLTIGGIVNDVMKEVEGDNRFTIGLQYIVKDFISIILDGGSNYNDELSLNLLYKTALQFKIYDDFYARVSYFNDQFLEEDGSGVGLGWYGPKLMFDIAFKNTRPLEFSRNPISYNQDVKETSFSLSYNF